MLLYLKGNVVTHIFPLEDATYLYGLTETIGGLGDFVIPYAAGYIDINLRHGNGLCFIGACAIFGSILLCAPADQCSGLLYGYLMRSARI